MNNFSSTQSFTEISAIRNNIAFLKNKNAVLILEVSSINFTLLSKDEQNAKIFAYASLLNSLSFPIQIFINNKKVDISAYLSLLDSQINLITDQKVLDYMKKYKDFIEQLVTQNTVLDKKFYLVIPHYYGATEGNFSSKQDVYKDVMSSLKIKSESLTNQFDRLGLQTRVLLTDEILKLFKGFYRANEQEEVV